ncbi:GNAT family N-acetyltransferase [Mobilitalea sibirica]|uniref:GNAT family N-acetyltransferase n=1 Tax=Mobilitalea sibirica TaxID=1462919 RepID=A0A8J7H1T8_9FIRM|nr:GNAT family N-acetyltransferase [Mobilitalea sibirica]MBH1940275.1 GNAT family N-acetyltransferase [Mobilitalea sibirica]
MNQINISLAQPEDLDTIYEITTIVAKALEDNLYFSPDSKEITSLHIIERGFTLLASCEEKVVGFLAVRIPQSDNDNLGYDISMSKTELHKVAHIETVAVLPNYRGKGLHVKLLNEAEKLIRDQGLHYSMATVYPNNRYSLNNFLNRGYKIVKTTEKYGGLLRHIVYKDLFCEV